MNKFDAIFIKNTIKNKRKDRYTLATVKKWMASQTQNEYEINEAIDSLLVRNVFEIIERTTPLIKINRVAYEDLVKEYSEISKENLISSSKELQSCFESLIRSSRSKQGLA
jgi:hypothetical protein|nr:MAG TPA: hypothetical protein [Caudoviricetes sp.]